MNQEVVEEMLYRRVMIEEVIRYMNCMSKAEMDTPDGIVTLPQLKNEAHLIDLMIIDELDEIPTSGLLINLI